VTAAILRVRGHDTPEAVRCFLNPDLCGLHDPLQLPDIRPAIERLHRAITTQEPLLVYGDYDVDGVTSTAMLMRSLKSLRANVSCKIPERKGEGYGLNIAAMEEAARAGIKLILTADCGIRDIEAVTARQRTRRRYHHHRPPRAGHGVAASAGCYQPEAARFAVSVQRTQRLRRRFQVMQALLQEYWPRHADSFWEKFVEFAGMAAWPTACRCSTRTAFWRAKVCAAWRVLRNTVCAR
jgi:hypothetical protein